MDEGKAETQPAVSFRNVSKRFQMTSNRPQTILETLIALTSGKWMRRQHQELWALRDLSFDLMPGESLGIIGRNGSGKSTLLKLIARILRPNSGQIIVRGRVSALLELGAGFHPDLTGRENVYLNGSLLGLTDQQVADRFQDIVDFSELNDFIDVPVKHYSSGMYMRLSFSVAVHVNPDILLIDEILAVGDQGFQEKCTERIYQLQRQGTTIVLVSHHPETVRDLCSHVLWIENGILQDSGPVDEILENYSRFYATSAHEKGDRQEKEFKRRGTGEIEIESVRLLDEEAQEASSFATGGLMTVAIDYVAQESVRHPCFEVTIYHENGTLVNGPNRRSLASPNTVVTGSGTVCYRIDYLPLLTGDYRLSIAVHDGHNAHPYDYHEKAYPFHVEGKETGAGLVAIPATWEWLPNNEQEKTTQKP
ncbi:MAG: ABC transporter ATP-binding protein [Candidatus Promineifilaceae bacterium]|nr:ABC transporter ATP-binding protein [Candidatus Promineifilaceae bacterium]